MRKSTLFIFFILLSVFSFAQSTNEFINRTEVERIEKVLSADEMEGRGLSTRGIGNAANFIAKEFGKAGLQPLSPAGDFFQTFSMVKPRLVEVLGSWNHQPLSPKKIIVITSLPKLQVNYQSGFEKASIMPGASLFYEASKFIKAGKNFVVMVDSSFSKNFARLAIFKEQLFSTGKSVIFILTNVDAEQYEIKAKHDISSMDLSNVVGVLPGKSLKNEYVIFSAHYDHLGIEKSAKGDSIFNGANDDAAGTTAVIMLANYFKSIGNNERTLIFAAFTAEESGGFGSQYFSGKLDAARIVAMFNIEMIGTESKWGNNSAYITGYDKSDMGKILQQNLDGTGFTFYPDPYIEQQLFYRSDNASLARLGVPAHTISTSKMDNEKYYHTVDDEIETLDLDNMTKIIQAIALSSGTIVNGKDSPTRVRGE